MAKQVKLNIVIDENGLVHVKPSGTEGVECLDLMSFLDKIDGFSTIETIKNKDSKRKKVQIASTQKIES